MVENTPKFIKQVPWYALDRQGHGQTPQEPQDIKPNSKGWYDRGKKGQKATIFRKGACENCGAMGHNKKQCTERPRKILAKYNNQNIAGDDITTTIKLNWQAKRDRWNGYQAQMYKQIIQEHNQYESIRKKNKMQEGEDDLDAEFKHTVDPMSLAQLPSKNTAVNKNFQGLLGLRNRQDRAKYLNNLEMNSNFDPKSRTMKGEDDYNTQLLNQQIVGQKKDLTDLNKFAQEQFQQHHAELNSTALPTLTQKIFKNVKQKKQVYSSGKLGQITKKYNIQTIHQKPKDMVYEEEDYFECPSKLKYNRVPKSKYEQNILINDHSSVWGSWYNKTLGWGYSCCHSNDKLSYCLSSKGKQKALTLQLKIKAQKLREQSKIDSTNHDSIIL